MINNPITSTEEYIEFMASKGIDVTATTDLTQEVTQNASDNATEGKEEHEL